MGELSSSGIMLKELDSFEQRLIQEHTSAVIKATRGDDVCTSFRFDLGGGGADAAGAISRSAFTDSSHAFLARIRRGVELQDLNSMFSNISGTATPSQVSALGAKQAALRPQVDLTPPMSSGSSSKSPGSSSKSAAQQNRPPQYGALPAQSSLTAEVAPDLSIEWFKEKGKETKTGLRSVREAWKNLRPDSFDPSLCVISALFDQPCRLDSGAECERLHGLPLPPTDRAAILMAARVVQEALLNHLQAPSTRSGPSSKRAKH